MDYELGQLHFVMDLFKKFEKRDPAEILPAELPDPIQYESHRRFVKEVLRNEVSLRSKGSQFVDQKDEGSGSIEARAQLNQHGAPSQLVAEGYRWVPGTELIRKRSAA